MDFNTLLLRFGLNSTKFRNKELVPFVSEGRIVYEVEEERESKECPFCNQEPMHVHTRRWESIRITSTIKKEEILRIRRIRYKCPECHKTHTFSLPGIERRSTISNDTRSQIRKEFFRLQSFTDIADRYGISVTEIIRIFDMEIVDVPRRKFPEHLCIDEKHFETGKDGKYCVVLSDFDTGKVVDIIEDRRMPFLIRYFDGVSQRERENVKAVISDMYEGYSQVRNSFFPNAVYVIDLFHVVKLLSTAVNKIRIRTYNQILTEDTIERHFLKTNWKVFLEDRRKIRKRSYHSKKFDISLPTGEIIDRCLKSNMVFWDGYNVLQELLSHKKLTGYKEAKAFMDHMIDKLMLSGDDLLSGVAETYAKWETGITNGLSENATGRRFSNAIAECNNSHIQKAIDVAYGYRNFHRFRNRVMLFLSYKKGG